MADIGVVAVEHDLAAAGDIDPGDLANAGTVTHVVFPLQILDGRTRQPAGSCSSSRPLPGRGMSNFMVCSTAHNAA